VKHIVLDTNILVSSLLTIDGNSAHIKFYDVARFSDAFLITGNIRHYPKESTIVTPAEFLTRETQGRPLGAP
jgi:predicted nucleic acid-binding protein